MEKFIPKTTKKKIKSSYRSLYIRDDLILEIERIAKKNDTSINNVLISMIETCIAMDKEKK